MSTIGEKVSHAAGKTVEFITNPATAAQVVGRDAIAMIIDRYMAVNSSDSLISASAAARVEPLCLVDTDVLFVEELHDVLQTLNALFAGFYLQAIQLDSSFGSMKIIDKLNKFNPNGVVRGNLMQELNQTVKHATIVKHEGKGLGIGHTTGAMHQIAGLAETIQMVSATEAYADRLPDYSLEYDDIALEAAGQPNKRIRKVDPTFASDADYKNWKQERDLVKASQQDKQHRDRVNDRQRQLEDNKKKREIEDAKNHNAELDRQDKHQADKRRADMEAEREEHRKADREKQNQRAEKQDVRSDEDRKFQDYERRRNTEEHVKDRARTERDQGRADRDDALVVQAYGSDALNGIKEANNMAVGKIIDVEIKHDGQTFQIPVSIRLMVNTVPSAQLVHILSLSQELTSANERFHAWKAGRLSFVKDLLFARDLIDEHRRNAMKDHDSVYSNIVKKQHNSLAAALINGVPSVAAASNMIVCSHQTIADIELSMTGKFSDFHARQKIFERTSLMIVAVIDKEWNTVTFYHRGLADVTEINFRGLKAAGKGSGPDVSDILKAYTLGNSPSL